MTYFCLKSLKHMKSTLKNFYLVSPPVKLNQGLISKNMSGLTVFMG